MDLVHLSGLSEREAEERLKAEGPNELPRQGARPLFAVAFEVIREPMFGMLLAAGAIYLLLGDRIEAAFLLGFASLSVAITIIQESRSERVLEALRDLTSPRALVIRDGMRRRIPGREVVRGDLIVIAEGDRIAADALLVSSEDLQVDESLLTGESVPVRKRAVEKPAQKQKMWLPGGEDLPAIFSGTLVVRGHGMAEVTATGAKSRIGQIGQSLGGIESATPRLTQETRVVVRTVAVIGLVCCIAAVLLFGFFRGSWLDAFLAGIALGMSMLPEEFPLVLTVFMVMGAWRLSRARVLTRRAPAIETLGAATVLCTDKTGTLTENRMRIVELRTLSRRLKVGEADGAWPQDIRHLVDRGVLASAPEPFDPMEQAFHLLQHEVGGEARKDLTLTRAYPMRPELLAVTQAWERTDGEGHVVSVKGAPEAVIDLCRLSEDAAAIVRRQADEMAADGLRVLAVAEAHHMQAPPESPREFDFGYLGLVGLADPLREAVPSAVAECHSAGIKVLMITGDYPQTARAIAAQAGIPVDPVLTGVEIESLGDAALREAVGRSSVFARIMPEQKLRLVEALKQRGEVVAMTGDGVNDAPALRAADIGIAMGGRGTDVAREASAIVLLDDDFNSIVTTVRLGRRIYDNLRKAMTYILAIHVPIAGIALLPLLTGLPIVFWPLHIAFLEMVIDPMCSIVFEVEKAEADVMRRAPRPPQRRLLSGSVILWAMVQGAAALALLALIYLLAARSGMADAEVRALTFVSLVLINLALVLVNRSYGVDLRSMFGRANAAFLWIAAAAIAVITVAVTWPPAERLFGFGVFHAHDLAVSIMAAAGLILVLELGKRLFRSRLVS